MKKRILRKEKGITLIALIVTIIILLILAGVSLSLISGGNGILNKAQNAVETTNEAAILEEVQLAIAEGNIKYYLEDNRSTQTLIQYLASNKFSPYETGSGAQITVAENGEITYTTAQSSVYLTMDANGNVAITAKDGTKLEYTVTYQANAESDTVENLPTEQKAFYNDEVTIDFSKIPTREKCTFLGWSTDKNATTAMYTEEGTKAFTMKNNNVTLYAVWSYSQAYHAAHPEKHIPTGFAHTEGTVDTGYVIADNEGNEFVWIPVASSKVYQKRLGTNNWYVKSGSTGADAASDLGNDVSLAVAGDTLGVNTILRTSVSNTLANQPEASVVNKAGGFWVGKYESGVTSVERADLIVGSSGSNSLYNEANSYWAEKKIIIQAGAEPARMITQTKSLELANNWKRGNADTAKGTVAFQSGLITGTQWDVMCNFIGWDTCDTDCSSWGNYGNVTGANYTGLHSNDSASDWINASNAVKQGNNINRWVFPSARFVNSSNGRTSKKNIYDIAGNVWEWTTEVPKYNVNNSVLRGGGANVDGRSSLANCRNGNSSTLTNTGWHVSFRLVLYVE